MDTLFKALMTLIPGIGILLYLTFVGTEEIDIDDWEQIGITTGWVLYHLITVFASIIYLIS
jgi:hypothetical protein